MLYLGTETFIYTYCWITHESIRKQNTYEMKPDHKVYRTKHVTWTWWTTLPWMNGGVATIRNGAGYQRTHFPSIVTVTFSAAIVPALLVLMSAPIHRQARACFNRRHKRSGCLCTKIKGKWRVPISICCLGKKPHQHHAWIAFIFKACIK